LIKATQQRQNKPRKTIEEISGCVRPERANKWPNSLIATSSSSSSSYGSTADFGHGLPFMGFLKNNPGLLVERPSLNLEDQFSIFMTPGDRVAQLCP
jgi:hypothetical protein